MPRCSRRSGPNGILINMARGSVVDEPALIKALQEQHDLFRRPRRVRQGAAGAEGADGDGPHRAVPASRLRDRVTRAAMDQLVVDNLLAWAAGKPPLTPVPETPWPPKRA